MKRLSKYQAHFRPSASSLTTYRKMVEQSPEFVCKNIEDAYMKHLRNARVVVESAKIYILKNWKRVKDWSDLDVEIRDNTKKETWYYSHKELTVSKRVPKKGSIADKFNSANKLDKKEESAFERLSNELERELKAGHNPVKSLTDVVLDHSDGDFSLKINGHPHLWIDSESIVVIAAFIEEVTKKKAKS